MGIYLKLFEVLFPVFLIIGIGYYLGKKDPKIDTRFITKLAGTFGTPALIFYALTTTGVNLEIFTKFFVYEIIAIIFFSVAGILTLFLTKRDIIQELPPLILPNNGNIGLPICLFAFGSIGLGIAAAIASVIMLFHFTIGILLAKKEFDFKILIKNGPIYGILTAFIFLYFEIKTPIFLENATFLIGYATIFLVLMSLGIALTKLKVFSLKLSLVNSFTRMVIGPIIGLFLINLFDLKGVEAGVLFIQCSMPSAILTYLVGSMYSPKKIVDSIASTIVVSTIISFITLPIIVYISLLYFS
tara:strand:- start:145 stop:1044 length:900 start_codon:yes stop_codon:yes gene_type:complete